MQRENRRALIALNVALLGVLGVVTLTSAAGNGQGQPGPRPRGTYTMVSGQIQGGNTDAVYIVDATNQELIVMRWNVSKKVMDGIGYRNLTVDAQARPGR